jgi:demethylmenaquinone methyltransferase/2-methoxy-6-polyprenyl-1,4-benzoquinol methylase
VPERRFRILDLFGLVAPFYDRVMQPPDAEVLHRLARIDGAARLLDVGGGTGRVSQHLQKRVAETWILDLSRGMLRQTAGKLNLIPCQGMAEALPFAGESFPRIVAVDSFHHFHNHRLAAQELLRVLEPGGTLVIEEPNIRRFPVKLVALGERLALMRSHFYPPQEMIAFFDMPDTEVSLHQRDWNYWVVVEKRH